MIIQIIRKKLLKLVICLFICLFVFIQQFFNLTEATFNQQVSLLFIRRFSTSGGILNEPKFKGLLRGRVKLGISEVIIRIRQ